MKTIATIFTLTLICILGYESRAQQYNLEPAGYADNTVGLRTGLPIFKDGDEISNLSGMYTLYGLINLKKGWSLYGEIPVIITKLTVGDESTSDNGLGSIFLGARKTLNEHRTSLISFGVYLPTIGEEHYVRQSIGLMANPYRIAQSVSATTVYGNYSYSIPQEENGIFGFDIGPEVWFPTYEDSESEFWLHLGVKGGYKFNKLQLWAEFAGQMWLSEKDLDTRDRLWSQIGFGAQLNLGKFNPGIYYGIPLTEEFKDEQSGILGFKVEFQIPAGS